MCRRSIVLTLQGTSTGLYAASSKGNLKVIEYLLEHGADVNQPCDVSNWLRNNNLIIYRYQLPFKLDTSIPSVNIHSLNISNVTIPICLFLVQSSHNLNFYLTIAMSHCQGIEMRLALPDIFNVCIRKDGGAWR